MCSSVFLLYPLNERAAREKERDEDNMHCGTKGTRADLDPQHDDPLPIRTRALVPLSPPHLLPPPPLSLPLLLALLLLPLIAIRPLHPPPTSLPQVPQHRLERPPPDPITQAHLVRVVCAVEQQRERRRVRDGGVAGPRGGRGRRGPRRRGRRRRCRAVLWRRRRVQRGMQDPLRQRRCRRRRRPLGRGARRPLRRPRSPRRTATRAPLASRVPPVPVPVPIQRRVIEPDRVRVRAAQEALDDAELDQAAHVDREVVEGEVVDPG